MPVPKSGPEFVELFRKSGLLDQFKLDQYLTEVEQSGQVDPDAGRLASRMVKDGKITPFQARHLLRGRYKGFFLGQYKVLESLGSGGMADVYLCEHATMGHKVAVKILPIEKLKDPSLLGRFRREAQAIATLNHPNIVRAFDLDHVGNLHYLVTEYVEGCDLQDFVKRNGPLTPERASNYIAQAAAGLQHLLDAGLVHRDIKPGNLLLDRIGNIKLMDLGLARFNDIDRQDNLTRDFDDGRVLGTADYIAPEQSIKGSAVDIRADLYSLGGTFYFLLKGEAPFEGASVTQKLLFHQIKDPPPLPASVPQDIVDLIQRMIKKKPEDRPQTPTEIFQSLRKYAHFAYPPSLAELPARSSVFEMGGPKSAILKGSPSQASRIGLNASSSSAVSLRAIASSETLPALHSTPVSGISSSARPAGQAIAPSNQPAPSQLPSKADRGIAQLRGVSVKTALLIVSVVVLVLAGTSVGVLWVWSELLKPATAGIPDATVIEEPQPETVVESAPKDVKPIDVPVAKNNLDVPAGWEPVTPKGPVPTQSLRVTSSGAEGTFRTIRSALIQGGANCHIVVLDPEHQEQLDLDGASGVKNVTIEAWPTTTQPIILRAPRLGDSAKPILRVNIASGIRFKGFVIDGQGNVPELVQYSGPCEGSVLENCRFIGFTKSAVVLSGVTGSAESPVTLKSLRFVAAGEVDAAIRIESNGQRKNSHHVIEKCRMEGPLRGAVIFSGSAENVEMRFNRFYKNKVSVLYQPAEVLAPTVTLRLTNNVFYEPGLSAIHFEIELHGLPRSWVVQNNLFLNSARICSMRGEPRLDHEQGASRFETGGNIRTVQHAEEVPNIASVFEAVKESSEEIGTNPADDATFLRYSRAHRLMRLGVQGKPVGYPTE